MGEIRKVKGNLRRKKNRAFVPPVAVPGAQTNLHQHSHAPVPQLLLPCGIHLRL